MVFLIVGIVLGFFIGFLLGRIRLYRSDDLSRQASVSNLITQIAEIRVKFEEVERAREKLEEQRRRLDEEREKRFREFVDSVHRIFKELSEKTAKIDEEKDKRIEELVEQMKKFFEEQKKHTERFLLEQGKSREEIEKRRDAQIEDMKRMIHTFTKTVSGTKTRGITGEKLLKEALRESIKAGLIKCNLRTDNGEVEFAWDLGDGKYIPIDSKMPDVFEILQKYDATDDVRQKESYAKTIMDKVKKEIKRVQKYQNLSNTIDSCILVIPEAILDIAPELIGVGKQSNVYLCSYKDVFLVAHTLQDQYIRLKEEGDIGRYKQVIKSLFQILDNIASKTDSIARALTTIQNANDKIKAEIMKARRAEDHIVDTDPVDEKIQSP